MNSCLSIKQSTFSDRSYVINNNLQLEVNKHYIAQTKPYLIFEPNVNWLQKLGV